MPASARAAVFDLDGTLVDNMRFHIDAWVEFASRIGHRITRETVERDFAGKRNDEIFTQLLGPGRGRVELDKLADEKEALYRSIYAEHAVPMPGLLALLAGLRRVGVRCAIATSAPKQNRDWILARLDLFPWFEQVVGAEAVARGKPFPDIFLAAAEALSVAPGDCVAFEDAVNGVRSAADAGMRVAGLTTMTEGSALTAAGARWIVSDYRTLPEELAAALGQVKADPLAGERG